MSIKVFISRKLEKDSLFQRLRLAGIDLMDLSMLHFESIDFDFNLDTDWLFFYSANGVKSFYEKLSNIPNKIKLAAVGEKTAAVVQHYFGKIDFVGSGSGENSYQDFKAVLTAGDKITVVRAINSENVLFNNLLSDGIVANEIVCYKNTPIPIVPKIEADIYIFTSSLNARTFLAVNTIPPTAKIVSIGIPTTNVLTELGFKNITTASHSSEEELYKICVELLGKQMD